MPAALELDVYRGSDSAAQAARRCTRRAGGRCRRRALRANRPTRTTIVRRERRQGLQRRGREREPPPARCRRQARPARGPRERVGRGDRTARTAARSTTAGASCPCSRADEVPTDLTVALHDRRLQALRRLLEREHAALSASEGGRCHADNQVRFSCANACCRQVG